MTVKAVRANWHWQLSVRLINLVPVPRQPMATREGRRILPLELQRQPRAITSCATGSNGGVYYSLGSDAPVPVPVARSTAVALALPGVALPVALPVALALALTAG